MLLRTLRSCIVIAVFAVLVIGGVSVCAAPASAATYNLTVSIPSTSLAVRKGVSVTVSGGGLVSPVTKLTNSLGTAKFTGLAAGSYKIVPAKAGYRFIPAQKTMTLSGTTLNKTASFTPVALPAVGSVSPDYSALTFIASAGPIKASQIVTVTLKTATGKVILGAPVNAVIADPTVASVSPASGVTNSLGQFAFTIVAGDSAGTSVATFGSGGWRGTPVKTATTDITVNPGFPEAASWAGSGHGDTTAEAFNHWNSSGSIPADCAKCHSRPGFLDFLGVDGTTAGMTDNPAPIGTTVDCLACHNARLGNWSSVTFPSGKSVDGLGVEAFCMECHQGLVSTPAVDSQLSGLADDTVDTSLSFTNFNIHYFAAAASLYGTQAQGGYEYPSHAYTRKFPHVDVADTCVACHNEHSLQVNLELCATCHAGVATLDDLRNIRMSGSFRDYNGNGNTSEGIFYEIEGLADALYPAIRLYAATWCGPAIAYTPDAYPYWFFDSNDNGVVDGTEGSYANKYAAWTPRLVKAAYNYHFYRKEPGNFAHNAKYMIELLFDALSNLSGSVYVDLSGKARDDLSHFNPLSEAFRHWDGDPGVDAKCSRCHSGSAGFDYYLANGYTDSMIQEPPISRMDCQTCHAGFSSTAPVAPLKYVFEVIFPGRETWLFNDAASPDNFFICLTCHQGRQSMATVNAAVSGMDPDTIDTSLSFLDVHHSATGGILYGTQARVAYEYPGETYNGAFTHTATPTDPPAQCTSCHIVNASKHSFLPEVTADCLVAGCHEEATIRNVETIRKNRATDYNGNGNTTEWLREELNSIASRVVDRISLVAEGNGYPINYDSGSSPYWYEADGSTPYAHWTPKLLKAAFNYHYYIKEYADWAHNTDYTAQFLWDSLVDLGGDTSGLNVPGRP